MSWMQCSIFIGRMHFMDQSPSRLFTLPQNQQPHDLNSARGPFAAPIQAVSEDTITVNIQGELVSISLANCLTSLSTLSAKDRVLVQYNGEEWFAYGRCMRKGERPIPISYDIKQGLCIDTPKGQILIDTQGNIRINGQALVMRSDSVDIEVEDQAKVTGPIIRLG